MCDPGTLAALGTAFGGAGAATATGAVAGAGALGAASTLSTLGTLVTVGGTLAQGIAGANAARQQSSALAAQAANEAQLNAVQDQRRRSEFATAIAQQRAELAARGVQLDSVTAMALGRTAAQEMSFDSQAIRSQGQAKQMELTASQRIAEMNGRTSVLTGVTQAAGTLLSDAPDLWPGFFR